MSALTFTTFNVSSSLTNGIYPLMCRKRQRKRLLNTSFETAQLYWPIIGCAMNFSGRRDSASKMFPEAYSWRSRSLLSMPGWARAEALWNFTEDTIQVVSNGSFIPVTSPTGVPVSPSASHLPSMQLAIKSLGSAWPSPNSYLIMVNVLGSGRNWQKYDSLHRGIFGTCRQIVHQRPRQRH